MQLNGLLDKLSATSTFESLVQKVTHSEENDHQDVIRSARPYVIAALANRLHRPVLVVTARSNRAYDIAEQIPVWCPQARITRFQEPTPIFYERTPWTSTVIRSRIRTLARLAPPILQSSTDEDAEQPSIIVTSAHALMQKTLPVREFRANSREYSIGQVVNLDKLLEHWVGIGYEPVSVVVEAGTFSRRGGIIDVFPAAADFPVRIEFFGDEIDSLRSFDPATQRSVNSLSNFTITPTREILPKHMKHAVRQLGDWMRTLPDPEADPTSAQADLAMLETGLAFPAAEYYLPYVYPYAASLLDYLADDTLVVIDDWQAFEDAVADQEEQALEQRDYRAEANQLPLEPILPYHTWDALSEHLTTMQPLHLGSSPLPTERDLPRLGDLFKPGPRYGGQVRSFLEQLLAYPRDDQMLVVTRQAERFAELWAEGHAALPTIEQVDSLDDLGRVNFIDGELSEGWILQEGEKLALHLYSDAEIFGWRRPEPRRRRRPRKQNPEVFFADLAEGDAVVHVDYGVGIFKGIIKRKFEETEREYLLLEYAGNDVLYVPIHQADRLSRYVGVDDKSPKLNRLGTQDWIQTRRRASEAAREIADELLSLYAARTVVQGYAFGPDTPWQHELEASFPYVETDDQLSALREVKADMEATIPMDRLICGDVGYGKTEVALRAAFKAVTDGKQVAVLVPTTVLAQQHYATFSERLTAFPVKVEMLSRFRTAKEQEQILRELEDGQVDIVIGTHRLLQKDVAFKDLGLLVIDEEQRFGVTHKETLKQKRTEVDVLTMTATPIPRTLHMALTGVRDISLIQTAPEERLPVVTFVGVYDDKLVRQAILRELDRGGQVFFVHNRVRTIETVAKRLRLLVPEASIDIGHGQMDDSRLEEVISSFARGDCDVLISTTIIENGVDIPNANTMIVDRADQFGLAQLYQLRGRVGRSAQQAFVYFMHPRHSRLTEEARARLDTINEYTDLGVGMSIAMRDLEIRGMGDMLGARQSGHIEAVGFHLYTQLLTNAVNQLRGEGKRIPELLSPEQQVDTGLSVTIDLPLPSYLPTDYVNEMNLRLQLYRRLANIHTEQDVEAMEAELEDRFGELPLAVQGLLFQIRIKILAQKANASAIGHEAGKISIRLPYLGSADRAAIQRYVDRRVKVSRTALWISREEDDWQDLLCDTLRQLDLDTITEVFALQD
jgi:transcription-repair coupling factor (superfamily II helicase)